ncbi:MAG: hypothetical protein KC431_00930, partial [Myxococcales bacterium]|nr:hypothetical protein [Myxococcales bacterium]
LFAHDADPLINGGLPEVDFVFDMALNNSGGDLFIGFEGVVWDHVDLAPVFANESTSLDPNLLNDVDNDVAGNWCNGGVGTPRAANDACMGGGGG